MANAGPSGKHRRFGSEDPIIEDENVMERSEPTPSFAAESDDDAPPEAVSLGAGKEQVATKDKVLREREQRAAQLRKEANKAKAAVLKARKDARESKKSKTPVDKKSKRALAESRSKKGDGDSNSLHSRSDEAPEAEPVEDAALARMKRAMAQAESEDEEEGEGSWVGIQASVKSPLKPSKAKRIPDRLPESVFKAAKLAEEQEEESSDEEMDSGLDSYLDNALDKAELSSRKARHPRNRAKDVILGSRTIRPLPTTKQIGMHISLQRPQALREFRNKSLNVDGQIEHKSWQRVETHLAVRGKRLGPAKNFAQAHRLKS